MKRTNLFLLELVLDLVLFTLCAVVCVALLLTAKGMSQESRQLTEAVYIAQDAAERWRSGAPLYDFYPGRLSGGDHLHGGRRPGVRLFSVPRAGSA